MERQLRMLMLEVQPAHYANRPRPLSRWLPRRCSGAAREPGIWKGDDRERSMYTLEHYEDDVANNEDRPIPVSQVRRELERHNASWVEFVEEFGEHASYSARVVLGWLGY